MWEAVFADVGVVLIVVFNAIRVLGVRSETLALDAEYSCELKGTTMR